MKMVYLLNDECLNHQPIEKTKVSLATRVFSECSRNAMQYYIENEDDPLGRHIELLACYSSGGIF